MSARAEATLVAIVANVAATGTRWLVWPADVAPRGCYGRLVTIDTVQRHLRRSGYAVPARDGWMELTPAGLAAVDALRAARGGAA